MAYEPRSLSAERMVQELVEIDDSLAGCATPQDENVIIVVGGAALLLQGETDRAVTRDIDVLLATPAMSHAIATSDVVNMRVRAYGDCIPYNYEDRLRELDLGLANYRVGTPSLEDLVVMKLYGCRDNDLEDLRSEALLSKLDWDRLDDLVLSPDEARGSILSDDDYLALVAGYRDYRAAFGPSSPPAQPWPEAARWRGRWRP